MEEWRDMGGEEKGGRENEIDDIAKYMRGKRRRQEIWQGYKCHVLKMG